MSSDEARALFDAAIDGELDAEQQRAFEAALARDEQLRADYQRQRDMLRSLSAGAPQVDLLAGVQHKLRARSGGRFYRDRFAETRHARGTGLVVATTLLFVLAVALWFAYQAGLF